MDRGFRSFGQALGLVTFAALLLTETGHAARAETAQAEPPGEQSIHFDAKARAGKKDLLATLHSEGNFETLIKAVNAAGMAPQLQGHGPLTLLAPTDEAFAKVSAKTMAKWMGDPRQLKQVLRYHILRAYVPTKQLLRLKNVLTTNGLVVRTDSTSASISDTKLNFETKITKGDIWSSNGVIHAIDTVLVPPERFLKKGAKKEADEAEPAETKPDKPAGGHQS